MTNFIIEYIKKTQEFKEKKVIDDIINYDCNLTQTWEKQFKCLCDRKNFLKNELINCLDFNTRKLLED
jgi:hypothetical protein